MINTQIKISPPNEKQKKMLISTAKYVAYGGARGGGKSWAIQTKVTLLSLKYPGIRILLLRRTFQELRENHIRPLSAKLRGIANYSDSRKCFEFPNSSIIKMGYCDSESDVEQYQGQEYDCICIDEATQFTEYQFSVLKGCVRGVNDFPKRIYLTCNPGGVGHGWVKRLFIDKEYKACENPNDYEFIQALVTDNKVLLKSNPEYITQLKELPDSIREAWLYGNWDVYDGQYFSEFNRDIHVIQPFTIPYNYRIYRVFDYGLDMLACLWIAIDTIGYIYITKELLESNLIVSEAAKKISQLTTEEIYETIAPPDMWNRQKDTGKSMAELFADNGIDIVKADNNRVQGWMCVKEYLKPIKDLDGNISSRLKIFSNCKNLIKNIPLLIYDDKNPNDCSTQPHEITHITDALRYFCIARPLLSKNVLKSENGLWLEKIKREAICAKKRKRF